MQTKANGIDIHYRIDGDAGPWLVLSNSLATDLSMWEEQAKDFSSSFRVLRYDQRGHGKTEAPAGRYSFDLLIADALALMDALDIERANVCGLSMGGATALGLAQRHPGRIARAIVADSGCASTPQSAQQWRSASRRRRRAAWSRWSSRRDALVSGGRRGEEPALSRPRPRDDPQHAGQRLHRLLGGARRSRLPLRGCEH